MSKREIKLRKCNICGKEIFSEIAYCSLECLHNSRYARGDYDKKREMLNYLINHPEVSSREVARIFGVSKSVTERLCFFTDRKRVLYEVDENYFENINDEYKAYWLGFLFADGYVNKNKQNSCVIELALSEIDYNHLIKFRDSLKSNYTIKKKVTKLGNKTYNAYRFSIYREKMYNDLVNKGCVENKSLILKFPNTNVFADEHLIKHFIRGYIDGDGCLAVYGKTCHINILGTEHMLKNILDFLKIHTAITTITKPRKCTSKGKENIYELNFGKKDSFIIAKYLYENANIFLDRKYNKYLKMRDIHKEVL